jgi:acetyl-CoA carboxylase biotin carboxyl carrier protein
VSHDGESSAFHGGGADGQAREHGTPSAGLESATAALRDAALDLIAGLPERPRRVRLAAGSVSIDLDWRALPASRGTAPAVPAPAVDLLADDGGTAVAVADRTLPGVAAAPVTTELHYICAPSVGTFYHSPEPGGAPFVTAGAQVRPGRQVGVVEAMKLMLPVESDQAGRVVEVLVADGEPVEYQERLIALTLEG